MNSHSGKQILAQEKPRRLSLSGLFFAFLILGLVTGIFFIGERLFLNKHQSDNFSMLSSQDQRLAVYDAFCNTIEQKYFDKGFLDQKWRSIRQKGREEAANAVDSQHLYTEVLYKLTLTFPVSHVKVFPPQFWPSAKKNVAVAQKSNANETSNSFEGDSDLGFEKVYIQRGSNRILVVGDVFPNGVAERNGIEPGWGILRTAITASLDGNGHFEGEFSRPDQTAVKISYDFPFRGPQPDYSTRLTKSGARYIRFDRFDETNISKVTHDMKGIPQAGLILDLRGNIGGQAIQMYRLLGHFLPLGTDLGSQVFSDSNMQMRSLWPAEEYQGPIVILIGPKSSSAAEIVADILRIHRKAVLIGRASNGSVLKAESFKLPDGGQIIVPTADYLDPLGGHIEGIGVKPDKEILPTLEQIRAGHDPAIEEADNALKLDHI